MKRDLESVQSRVYEIICKSHADEMFANEVVGYALYSGSMNLSDTFVTIGNVYEVIANEIGADLTMSLRPKIRKAIDRLIRLGLVEVYYSKAVTGRLRCFRPTNVLDAVVKAIDD